MSAEWKTHKRDDSFFGLNVKNGSPGLSWVNLLFYKTKCYYAADCHLICYCQKFQHFSSSKGISKVKSAGRWPGNFLKLVNLKKK